MTKMKNRGFTLVEVMVAAAIAGGLALVIGTLTKQSNQTSVKMQSDIDATAIANEIMGYLSDPRLCGKAGPLPGGYGYNLYNKSITGLPGTISAQLTSDVPLQAAIRKADANYMYRTGTALAGPFYGSSNLAIKSYTFEDPVAGSADGVNSQATPRDMFLTIRFFKKQINQNAANDAEIIRRIKIAFQTDSNDTGTNIAFCKAVSTGYDGVWQRGTGLYLNDINFMGGNVGIGTATPDSVLEAVATGVKGVAYTGVLLNNTATSNTSSIQKTGLEVQSTGAWTGGSAVNVGLNVNATGGTINYSALFNGGNVGIGTSTPGSPLEISTASDNILRLRQQGGGWNYMEFYNDTVRTLFMGMQTDSLFTINSQIFMTPSNGYLGINVATPLALLDVNGNVRTGTTISTGQGGAAATSVNIGSLRTGAGTSALYLSTQTGASNDFSITRASGVNGNTDIVNAGSGQLNITNNSGNINLASATGNINLASTSGRVILNYAGMDVDGLSGGLGIYAADAATKRWVQQQIALVFSSSSPQTLNGLAASLANYMGSNTMNIIKEAICQRTRILANGSYVYYIWDGTWCSSTAIPLPPDCSQAGKCTNVYAINHVYAGGNMYASGGFCPGGGGCLTRADRLRCPDGYFMYGIAYGFPQCKYTGVGTPTANWHTTGPYAY